MYLLSEKHVIFFLLLQVNGFMVCSVVLDETIQRYIKKVIVLFEKDMQSSWFDHVIQPPVRECPEERNNAQRQFLLPKLFIWAPAEHFKLQLWCPTHGALMTGKQWTDVVSKKSYLNPRMVYDLSGNIILVQRYYQCTYQGFDRQCRYLSGSEVIMECLPKSISNLFPIKKYHKSCCTTDLVNLVETLVLEGNNFLKISEIIANLNLREFSERNKRFQSSGCQSPTNEKCITFYEDVLFSFPSDIQLIRIYLDRFEEMKFFYREEMEKVEATSLSCDHTFKVSKNIGCYRDTDGRYVKQFGFLLLLLNENNEIVDWRLTKTAGYSEVKSLLQNVKERKGVNVKSIHVDNCCQSRKQIQEVMGEIPVKLDLFHAVQRVTNVVPKGTEFSKTICKEFSLVFRQDGDLGESRMLNTPEPAIINRNLDSFCERWQTVLASGEFEPLSNELEKLRRHINNDCLSQIVPGAGTAGNERIHRCLNRSLLCGTSIVGPELAIAILTTLIYILNMKRKGEKHFKNCRVVPCVPMDVDQSEKQKTANKDSEESLNDSVTAEMATEKDSSMSLDLEDNDMLIIADDIQHLLSDPIAKKLVHTSNQIYRVLDEITNSVNDKSANFFDLPFMQMITSNALTSDNSDGTEVSNNHRSNLTRNLASFGLTSDPVSGDGDCVFSSIVKQLKKLPQSTEEESPLAAHLLSSGLGRTEEEDAYTLRQLFVNNVQSNELYQVVTGVSPERLNEETELFRERGTFCGNLGDLVVRVCADLLQVPIVVITSLASFPYTTFLPDSVMVSTPLYLAYDATACGHYDATRKQDSEISVGLKGCSCGKNITRGDKASCLPSARCPCVKKGMRCSRKCICKNCRNHDIAETTDNLNEPVHIRNLKCRCGEGVAKKTTNYAACKDGKTKSRCPCLGNGQGCSSSCECVGCENVHGARSGPSTIPSGIKRKRSPGIYKRAKGCEYLTTAGIPQARGPWTNYESVLLSAVIRLISVTDVEPSAENISKLFNFVVSKSNNKDQMPITPASKTAAQITAKLAHYEKKREVAYARLPTDAQ